VAVRSHREVRHRARRPVPDGRGRARFRWFKGQPPGQAALAAAILLAMTGCAAAALLLYPFHPPRLTLAPGTTQVEVDATVTAVTPSDCGTEVTSPVSGHNPDGGCAALRLLLSDGPGAGRGIVSVVPIERSSPIYAVGDKVVLLYSGGQPTSADSYAVSDRQRGSSLWIMALLFAGSVVLVGKWRGVAALVALGITFLILILFVLPAILAGRAPLSVALVGASLAVFAALYLSHGVSVRTSTAVVGSLLSLGLIGMLSALFTAATHATGIDEQSQPLLRSVTGGISIDAHGLLLAGVVIGALGVLNDVTVTQSSAVWELYYANPRQTARHLFAAAMRIGRDHMSSSINTLVLAYVGSSLPLVLLISTSGVNFADFISSQEVTTELVRAVVGSLGLIASIPITTGLATVMAHRQQAHP